MLAAKKHDPSAVKVLDEQKENLKVLKKRSKKTTAAQNGRAFIACVTACALILCFSLVAVEAKLGKVGYEINEVKTQITELEAQCEVADLEIEQMKSLERIESYAKNNLGMVSIESSDIIYLNMEESQVAIAKTENPLEKTLASEKQSIDSQKQNEGSFLGVLGDIFHKVFNKEAAASEL